MLKSRITLMVPGGAAKPNPKLGQALGPLGINMAQFCKEINEKTSDYRSDVPLRIKLNDRSFNYKIKPPATSWFVKKCVGLEKLSPIPKKKYVATLPIQYVYEIAKLKREMDEDMQKMTLEMICKQIMGQCSSMGVLVVVGEEGTSPKPIKITLK